MEQVFHNDNDVVIKIPDHKFSQTFKDRWQNEKIFRQIHSDLINKGHIKGNIVDSGSWLGDNAIPWAKLLPDSTVYAIDPSRENLDFTTLVAKENNLDNVHCIEAILSDNVGKVYTSYDINHIEVHKVKLKHMIHEHTTTTLDLLKLKDIGYIHLDVEGFELNVVIGADKLIREQQPIMTLEQHLDKDPWEHLVNHLDNRGYDVYRIDEVLIGNNLDCRNFLDIPKGKIDIKTLQYHRYLTRLNDLARSKK